ncbi:MAG: phage major capsid protein [Caulobacteraceae bacterium]|nr:phage major capsid protein [Caulobacteraceae bacterium]
MPIGGGILPAAGTSQYTELTYVTRRAFVPKLVVQIYNSTPLLAALMANSQSASGGASSVTVPVQGSQFVNAQWSDYSGSFAQPTVQQGITNAEFNLKLMITPVPFLGMEGLAQQDAAIIPLIEARMNDATNVMMDAMATALYNNTTNNQQFIGLPGAIDDGTTLGTYGNIARSGSVNTWWRSKVYAAGSANPTRQNVLQYLSGTVKNGAEVPTFAVCGLGTWTLLAQDFVGQEQYVISPGKGIGFDSDPDGPQSGFRALMVGGIPVYADPYCPEGTLYYINSNYLSLYIHDNGSFVFTGFESTLPNWQIGYVGAVLMIAELVNVKPRSMTKVTGFNYLSL